ncbi:MAG: GNAT family N-acetyltransferase [Succinivibrio sp.]
MKDDLFDLAISDDKRILCSENFRLRLTVFDDAEELLKVYSDQKAQPLFNADNCHGDDFCYQSLDRMRSAIEFWIRSFENRQFVRFSIVALKSDELIGTVELFVRSSEDYFNDCAILRLDLRSDYEQKCYILEILSVIRKILGSLHICFVATKSRDSAEQRCSALESSGYIKSCHKLIGFDGTKYDSYYELRLSEV